MLNRDDNENGFKTNRSNQQKNKFARAAHFFVFPLPSFCTTTTLSRTTKTSNFLVTHYFYGGIFIVVCAYPIFCFLLSCLLLFFTATHFHLAGCQHFSFSHRHFEFLFLFLRNSSALFSITHSSSFSVIHVNVNINNNTEKDTTFFFCPDVNYNISNQEY